MVKFLRRSWDRYSRLGAGRKKKQKWKKPTGRHNKMREKRRGYLAVVSIGYRKKMEIRGVLNGKKPIIVRNMEDLKKINEKGIAILGNIGKKKKIEIAKKAKEMKINFFNINIKNFLKKEVNKKQASNLSNKDKQKPLVSSPEDNQRKEKKK